MNSEGAEGAESTEDRQKSTISRKRLPALDRGYFYCHLFAVLIAQFAEMPHDFFFDELSKDNFLSSLLLGFRDIIITSEQEEMERIETQKYDLLESTRNATISEAEYKEKLNELRRLESMWSRLIILWNVFSDQLQDKFNFVWTREDFVSTFAHASGNFEDDFEALYG